MSHRPYSRRHREGGALQNSTLRGRDVMTSKRRIQGQKCKNKHRRAYLKRKTTSSTMCLPLIPDKATFNITSNRSAGRLARVAPHSVEYSGEAQSPKHKQQSHTVAKRTTTQPTAQHTPDIHTFTHSSSLHLSKMVLTKLPDVPRPSFMRSGRDFLGSVLPKALQITKLSSTPRPNRMKGSTWTVPPPRMLQSTRTPTQQPRSRIKKGPGGTSAGCSLLHFASSFAQVDFSGCLLSIEEVFRVLRLAGCFGAYPPPYMNLPTSLSTPLV